MGQNALVVASGVGSFYQSTIAKMMEHNSAENEAAQRHRLLFIVD
jgi:hypothetical protein